MTTSDLHSIFESDTDGLLEMPEKPRKVTSSDRLERSFLEIVEFVQEHGREPSSQTRQIGERKLGARLDGIRMSDDKLEALRPLDTEFGLLTEPAAPDSLEDVLSDDGLGLLEDETGLTDTADLPVRVQRNDPDDVAQRTRCVDFDRYEPFFKQKHAELSDGTVKLTRFHGLRQIQEGSFFLLNGIMVFIAEVGEATLSASGETKQRLRCIFENGTESSMYRQSLSTRLYEDDGYAITTVHYDTLLADDEQTGYIYVLKTLSHDPQLAELEDLYKIGFTRGSVEKRIANAEREPTYLMSPVEIVATYRTYNLKTSALEHLLHQLFSAARLNISQVGADSNIYEPNEWFVVPLRVIDEAIELIQSGEIIHYCYDSQAQHLLERPMPQ